jgi:hypothetical protein
MRFNEAADFSRIDEEENGLALTPPSPPGEGESFTRVWPIRTRWLLVPVQKQKEEWRRLQP